jgi:hypothetical protein
MLTFYNISAGIGNLVNDCGTYQESYLTAAEFTVKVMPLSSRQVQLYITLYHIALHRSPLRWNLRPRLPCLLEYLPLLWDFTIQLTGVDSNPLGRKEGETSV